MACSAENGTILLSVDPCHEPGSIKDWKNNFGNAQTLVESYKVGISDGKLVFEHAASNAVDNINAQGTGGVLKSVEESSWPKAQKSLSETLYNLNNLRKHETHGRR